MAKSIGEYKKDYEAARARGDAAGMKAANDGANAVRASLGLQTQSASEDIAKSQTSSKDLTLLRSSLPKTTDTGGSPGMSTSEILALGKGPLSSEAARNYVVTGSTTPTKTVAAFPNAVSQQPQKQVSVTDSPEYQSLMSKLDQMQWQLDQKDNDYSDYVRQLQEAAKAKSLAELEAAYKKNVAAIDAAKGQIAPQYTDARNQVAGQAAVQRKNWQETAAALGVNSGAAGQSDIAQNLAMQSNLAALDKAETSDMTALDLQRTQATVDYNAAIAQAEASGDYELAAALYQEKIRADEAARADQSTQFQQLLQRLQFEHGVSQDALAQQNYEQSRKDTLAQQAWSNRFQEEQVEAGKQAQSFNNLLTLVSSFAESTGDYSLFSQFGFTPEQIAAWNSAWANQHALELQQAYSKLAGGSKSGSGDTTEGSSPVAYVDPYAAMRQAGITDEGGAYAWALGQGNSSAEAAKLAEYFVKSEVPITSEEQLGETARLIMGLIRNMTADTQRGIISQQITDTKKNGQITPMEAEYLTRMAGY